MSTDPISVLLQLARRQLDHREKLVGHYQEIDARRTDRCGRDSGDLEMEVANIAEMRALLDSISAADVGNIICQAVTAIPPIEGDRPGSGAVRRYRLDGGRIVDTGEVLEALNIGNAKVCPGRWLQAKRIDGALLVDMEAFSG